MGVTERIFRELKQRLENGVYPPGSRFPSESGLADEFGVNKMTMNKIVSLLAEQQYLIRGVRGAGTRVADLQVRSRGAIAFLSPLTPYTVRILHGVYDESVRHNFSVLVESPPVEVLQTRLQMLCSGGVRGVVSVGYGLSVLPGGMCLFCVDSEPRPVVPEREVHFINSDNFQGGVQMMTEIFRRGHREVLVFSSERFRGRPDAPKTPRVCGFHQVMRENGIADFEERTFYPAPNSPADAKRFLRASLKKYPRTTLIAADSDGTAEMIHTAALQLGLDCPGKITLTGFGNVTQLPIANVNQNPERQGELAARYLIDYALTGKMSAPFCERVETGLTGVEYIPIRLR
ncbi:MAG: substrate-binding domain-containing protein [Lentisphaeria bacterium]|nr:substrate-binding domain-containing protein [Lentisphaeria bacterium]